ncbi:precorrin-8X methylmutase [Jiella sp. CQZ9-1]|uniref:Precorrin-8X methylmutase n=1 Tax=Jiella flava TaxID=2816857 RepID=A0A939JV82_9HYPH|nr:precorrin-8X methylmutase [Jiella flava]
MARLRQFLRDALADDKTVFCGFDFPLGYPRGASTVIAGEGGWQALWAYFGEAMQDRDDNFSNRFEVTGRLNREKLAFAPMYWGRPMHQEVPGLSVTKPDPYPTALPEKRLCEARTGKAQPVWKLNFTGSVGSQAITGLARLQQLRADPEFAGKIAVWPFETRFAEAIEAPIVLAEIYPSLVDIDRGEKTCLDEAQVDTLAELFARLDAADRFFPLLDVPRHLGEDDLGVILGEEGWIVGLDQLQEANLVADKSGEGGVEAFANGVAGGYLRDPAAIYAESFRIIRDEADLSGIPDEAEPIAVRMIHACGMTDIVSSLTIFEGAVAAGRAALDAGAPILCDSEMVAHGIISANLKQQNKIVCRLTDPRTRRIAEREGTTRSAAQVDLWGDDLLEGAIVAIGNAPTALFRLLERLDDGAPRPALIIGLPVGFVGAAESKAALLADSRGVPFVTLSGRLGGSALAAAVVNALAIGTEER